MNRHGSACQPIVQAQIIIMKHKLTAILEQTFALAAGIAVAEVGYPVASDDFGT